MALSVSEARENLLAMEDFIQLSEREGPFEFIDGQRVPKMPTGHTHSETIHNLYDMVAPFVRSRKLGRVYIETTFAMTDSPQWVRGSRIPDLMFVRSERVQAYRLAYPDFARLPLLAVPDLVVKIVSGDEVYGDVEDKVKLYLQDGVQMVWVVDTKTRSAHVRSGTTHIILSIDDTLTAPDVLPGFELPLHTIFAG